MSLTGWNPTLWGLVAVVAGEAAMVAALEDLTSDLTTMVVEVEVMGGILIMGQERTNCGREREDLMKM